MSLSGLILKLAGWKVDITQPDYPKSIVCVAPHTSNWDFVLCKFAYAAAGRKAGFLMKESWFFFPLGIVMRAIGGIPVPRRNKKEKTSLVSAIVERFNHSHRLTIAITPEGTRSRTAQWHSGFLRIAMEARIPILLGAIDYPTRHMYITDTFHPTGDIEADMREIKRYYSRFTGLYKDKFCTDNDA